MLFNIVSLLDLNNFLCINVYCLIFIQVVDISHSKEENSNQPVLNVFPRDINNRSFHA